MLEQLQNDCNEAFIHVLAFLGPKAFSILTTTNKRLHTVASPNHPAWYAMAKQRWPELLSDLEDQDFDWRNALKFSVQKKPQQAGEHLSDMVDEIARNLAKPKVHCSGTVTEDPRFAVPAANMSFSGLDLKSTQLRQLIDGGFCEQAPLGRGTETVVDLEKRKCWRLVLGKDVIVTNTAFSNLFTISASTPEAPLDCIKEHLVPHLFGKGEVLALPYCMNIYEEGGFFAPHRDTVKGPNHFGSCVVTLPVDRGTTTEGGELHLSCPSPQSSGGEGKSVVEEVVFETPRRGGEIKWHAFFTDVFHQVKPVTKGFRVSLTYHLWVLHTVPPPLVPRSNVATPEARLEGDDQKCRDLCAFVGHVLQSLIRRKRWATRNQFVFAFDHKYSWRRECDINALRGRDRVSFDILSMIMKAAALKHVEPKVLQFGGYDGPIEPRKFEKNEYLRLMEYELDGKPEYLHKQSESTVWINKERFISLEHEWESYSYDTGNEGSRVAFMYEHGCLVMKSDKYKVWD